MVRDSTKVIGANTVCVLCVSPAIVGIVMELDVVVFVAVVVEVVPVDVWLEVILAVVVVAEVVGGWELDLEGNEFVHYGNWDVSQKKDIVLYLLKEFHQEHFVLMVSQLKGDL